MFVRLAPRALAQLCLVRPMTHYAPLYRVTIRSEKKSSSLPRRRILVQPTADGFFLLRVSTTFHLQPCARWVAIASLESR